LYTVVFELSHQKGLVAPQKYVIPVVVEILAAIEVVAEKVEPLEVEAKLVEAA